jgi:hypothetical protein
MVAPDLIAIQCLKAHKFIFVAEQEWFSRFSRDSCGNWCFLISVRPEFSITVNNNKNNYL